MTNLGTQRSINDLLLRAVDLNKCIAYINSSQPFLHPEFLISARENLVAEFQHTVKQLEIELERLGNRDQTCN